MEKYGSIILERLEGADRSENITKSDLAWIKTELEGLGFKVEAKNSVRRDIYGLEKIDKEKILKDILVLSEMSMVKNTTKEAVINS